MKIKILKALFLAIFLLLFFYLFCYIQNKKKVNTLMQIIKKMSFEEKVAQTLFVGFKSSSIALINQIKPGGIIFFTDNIKTGFKYNKQGLLKKKYNCEKKDYYKAQNWQVQLENLRNYLKDIKLHATTKTGLLPFIGIDQEGGIVQRLKAPYITEFPGNFSLGASGNSINAFYQGVIIGQEINKIGFNLNFAPDIDLLTNPKNSVIGFRSYGAIPSIVISMGSAFDRGLRLSGVIPVYKHYPGHGNTDMDSHKTLPILNMNIEQLQKSHLLPFKKICKNADMIMTAHILVPKIDKYPATLSYVFLMDILRNRYKYENVIISDDFSMSGIKNYFSLKDSIERGYNAGLDIILLSKSSLFQECYNIASEYFRKEPDKLNDKIKRILKIKLKYSLFDRHKLLVESSINIGLKKIVRTIEDFFISAILKRKNLIKENIIRSSFTSSSPELLKSFYSLKKPFIIISDEPLFLNVAEKFFQKQSLKFISEITLINSLLTTSKNHRYIIMLKENNLKKILKENYDKSQALFISNSHPDNIGKTLYKNNIIFIYSKKKEVYFSLLNILFSEIVPKGNMVH